MHGKVNSVFGERQNKSEYMKSRRYERWYGELKEAKGKRRKTTDKKKRRGKKKQKKKTESRAIRMQWEVFGETKKKEEAEANQNNEIVWTRHRREVQPTTTAETKEEIKI